MKSDVPACVPHYLNERSSEQGNVTSYRVEVSRDGQSFREATRGTWAADGRMKVAVFDPTPARDALGVAGAGGGSRVGGNAVY